MQIKDWVEEILRRCGAVGAAVVEAGPVEPSAVAAFEDWISDGNAAGMDYLRNYSDIRRDPRLLLEGACSIVCCAFSFAPERRRSPELPDIAVYAYGDDYHDVIRRRLSAAAEEINAILGHEPGTREKQTWRVCIDSAPIMERYWAEKAGLGHRCRNGMLSVGKAGQQVFLAEIVAVWDINEVSGGESIANITACTECRACMKGCPGNAFNADATIDARRCISYLTIEHRGDWDETGRNVMATEAGRNTLYGCDRCLSACPLNRGVAASTIPEFALREGLESLDKEKVATMNQDEFSRLFKGSPIKRAKLAGLRRNASTGNA